MFNPYQSSIDVLRTEDEYGTSAYYKESREIRSILEDANSPVTRKYQEKLYESIMKKGHIDFGDIPHSRGDIKVYRGYSNMVETLNVIKALAGEEHATNVLGYVDIVQKAIDNIAGLSGSYRKGFTTKTDYVMMEYNVYVYFCVEATTALIYSFVDVMKVPDKSVLQMTIKNTTLRADAFYFEQLDKFNKVQNKMGINYRKMIETLCTNERNNFVGAEIVGVATVIGVAMAIVPITREIIYQVYHLRGKVSNYLDLQAKFLEMNKTCVESNNMMPASKRSEVIKKQEKLIKAMRQLSDKIRVKSVKSIVDSKNDIKEDNKKLSVDSIRDEVSDTPFEII